jgi:UDP-glucose 4-epimerase
MKILVTGGAGFIASHIVDAYVAAGHKVAIVDDLSSGKRKNINPRANFYKADIQNLAALRKIVENERPEVINHHAAFISVTDSVRKPETTFDINLKGTLNVLLAFADSKGGPGGKNGRGHKKLIFASTGGAIYGNPKKLPADEHTTSNPLSPYALTKQLAEETIKYFAREREMEYTILRYANVYGPRQRAQGGAGVFPIFSEQIAQNIRPTIFGDGKKTRDYVYVGDVARASVFALRPGKRGGSGETINIATARETSDYEVFAAIAAAYGFTQKPFFTPNREGEVRRISMSYARAKKILGWTPKVSFEVGVKKTLAS